MTRVLTVSPDIIPSQAETDEQVIHMWLAGQSLKTQKAYEADARVFLSFCGKTIKAVTVGDIQAFGKKNDAEGQATATQARKLSSVKSLLSFGHRIGFLTYNAGAVVKLPSVKNTLAERIIDEAAIQKLMVVNDAGRNGAIIRLIYGAGLRISEACSLKWRDLMPRNETGQATIYGKGGKTRVVILPLSVWLALSELKKNARPDDPVFRSRKGGHLDPVQVHRIIKAAAKRAGLPDSFSAHWLRHAHASHSIDRGAPIHLVQATLGHSSVATTGRYLHAKPTDSSGNYIII